MITYSGNPFDKVLYRNEDVELWNVGFYGGCITKDGNFYQFVIHLDETVNQIIPYNDSTACLLFTNNPAPEKYLIRERLQNQDIDEDELSLEMIYTVLEACIRRNDMYNISYRGTDLLIEEAKQSALNNDIYDKAMYVLHNGGFVQLSRIETPQSFRKPTTCNFDREIIFKVMSYFYQADSEFKDCFNDIITDTEGIITSICSYNYIIDTIVTEEITHIGEEND